MVPMKKEHDASDPLPFSQHLRSATSQVHTRAEKTSFIRGFLRGTASCDSYLRLLVDLAPVYHEMEVFMTDAAQSDFHGAPLLRPFHNPGLWRSDALAKDIAFLQRLCGSQKELPSPSPASEEYTRRVRNIANYSPVGMIGHLYTRYMGDMSGGRVLAAIASRSMGLGIGRGLDFYEFPALDSINEAKQQFRAALDRIDCDPQAPELREMITEESKRAFLHNINIFNGLKGNSLSTLFRNLPGFQRSPVMDMDTPVMAADSA